MNILVLVIKQDQGSIGDTKSKKGKILPVFFILMYFHDKPRAKSGMSANPSICYQVLTINNLSLDNYGEILT